MRKKKYRELVATKKYSRARSAERTVLSTSTPSLDKKLPQKNQQKSRTTNKEFFIVGIGASAGGLEAIGQVLAYLPSDTGMAFIIFQHLDPSHESKFVDILSRQTLMQVVEIKDGMRTKPNHIYVIPPNHNLRVLDGVLALLPRKTIIKGQYLPIDTFFESLAEDQKHKAIGVILSGTASDGTRGLSAIREEGGLTIAQDPKSAKYDEMPRSAIASGIVDLVLSPNQIAEALVRTSQNSLIFRKELHTEVLGSRERDTFCNILTLLKTQCHVDFSHYKPSTLKRRIARRMVLQKKETYQGYLEYLQDNLDEKKFLFADILINVTEFFRDPNTFVEFKAQIIPEIMKNKAPNLPIRIWVVGCSTGEEAYSIAMSLLEYMGESASKNPIQIFATDISELMIQKARAGVYHENIIKNVSEERLKRFFVKTQNGYKIKSFLREMCLFSWHDVTKAPPFAKLDLICCRNLLIYFDTVLQKSLIPIFHYALNPGGFLWLGSSESIAGFPLLFKFVGKKKNKFYLRKPGSATPKFHFRENTYISEKLGAVKQLSGQIKSSTDIQRETDHIVSLKYAPPGVVVNNDMEIVFIRGDTAPYLHLASGQATFKLFKLVRTEIASDLRMTIEVAQRKNIPVRKNGLKLRVGEQVRTFNLDITPFVESSTISERYFLISFEPVIEDSLVRGVAITTKQNRKKSPGNKVGYNSKLEQELSEARVYQHALVHDFETTQEELTASNEELQSTNEELQTMNEELETAKEELQSANEELTTLNDELQNRNTELIQLNNDLINLVSCVDIPIVMVTLNGCIRRFTPKAGKIMNLISSDIGRPISDLKPTIDIPNLDYFVLEVIETITPKEINVQDRDGHWFCLQIRPYKTTDNRIDGAILVLIDINNIKLELRTSQTSLDYAKSIANTVQIPLVVLNNQLQLKSANLAFYEKFHVTKKDENADLLTFIKGTKKTVSELYEKLKEVLVSNVELNDFEIECKLSASGQRRLLLNARRIQWIGEENEALLLSILDVTEPYNMERALKEAVISAEKANQAKNIFLATLSHELRNPLTCILSWAQLLLKTEKGSVKINRGLNIIQQSALIQGQLINDLLDISRIESGKLTLDIVKLNLNDIIQAVIETVRSQAQKKSLVIETHLTKLNGKVAGDPARLQQIIGNLLTNAIKFSPDNSVINVYLSSIEQEKQRFASIKVIDQGEGIAPEFLPHLFERFTQADSTTTRIHGGLGMGLAIVHDLLKLQGGTIRAENNTEGKGAVFTVLLPLIHKEMNQKVKVQKDKSSRKVAKEKIIVQHELDGLSILIVEDDQNLLDATTELLNSAGAKAIPVTSVSEALIAMDKYKPDILLSDIAMPEEDGYTFIRRIRARKPEQGGQIPAVALTAYAFKEDVNRVLLAGFNKHLAKPFNVGDLLRVVRDLVKKKK